LKTQYSNVRHLLVAYTLVPTRPGPDGNRQHHFGRGGGDPRFYDALVKRSAAGIGGAGSRQVRDRTARALEQAPTTAHVQAGAASYAGGSGPDGVLLCHGFTGSPVSMLPWAKHLEADGFRVRLPRLPGHGTTWREMNMTRWEDWYACVGRAFGELHADCERVFVCGLSMGGALALRLAEQRGTDVAAVTLVNPAIASADPRMRLLPVLRHLVPSLAAVGGDIALPDALEGAYDRSPLHAAWSLTQLWRDVQANLARVNQPMLIYKSVVDRVVDPLSLRLIVERARSADISTVMLRRSYHVATLDYDAEQIFTGSSEFFRRVGSRS
jgi:carboxylesterase